MATERDTYEVEFISRDRNLTQSATQITSMFDELDGKLANVETSAAGVETQLVSTGDAAQSASTKAESASERWRASLVEVYAAVELVKTGIEAAQKTAEIAFEAMTASAQGGTKDAIDRYNQSVDNLKKTTGDLVNQGGLLSAYYKNKERSTREVIKWLKEHETQIVALQKQIGTMIVEGLQRLLPAMAELAARATIASNEFRAFATQGVADLIVRLKDLIATALNAAQSLLHTARSATTSLAAIAKAAGREGLARELNSLSASIANLERVAQERFEGVNRIGQSVADQAQDLARRTTEALPAQADQIRGFFNDLERDVSKNLDQIKKDIQEGGGRGVGGPGDPERAFRVEILKIEREIVAAKAEGRELDVSLLQIRKTSIEAEQGALKLKGEERRLTQEIADAQAKLSEQLAIAAQQEREILEQIKALRLNDLMLQGQILDAEIQGDTLAKARLEAARLEIELETRLAREKDETVAAEMRANTARQQALILQRAQEEVTRKAAEAERARADQLAKAYREQTRAARSAASAVTGAADLIIRDEKKSAAVKGKVELALAASQIAALIASGGTNVAAGAAAAQHLVAAGKFFAVAGGGGGGGVGGGASGAGGATSARAGGAASPTSAVDLERERRENARALSDAIIEANRAQAGGNITVILNNATLLGDAPEMQAKLTSTLAPELLRVVREQRS